MNGCIELSQNTGKILIKHCKDFHAYLVLFHLHMKPSKHNILPPQWEGLILQIYLCISHGASDVEHQHTNQ